MRKRTYLSVSQNLLFKGVNPYILNYSIKEFKDYEKMDDKQKATLANLWLSYNIAKNLDFHLAFPKYQSQINPNLAQEFSITILGQMNRHHERNAKFIPMGMEYSAEKRIEFNSAYSWCNKSQWSMIFWHEMAHLIDTNHFSQPYLYEKVANFAKRATRYQPIHRRNKPILWYFTKPEKNEKQNARYKRATNETFAECFALIMTLATLGTTEETLCALVKKNYIIKTYINILLTLIEEVDFNKMGLRINQDKKQKMKDIFKAIHISEKKFVIKYKKCAKKFN